MRLLGLDVAHPLIAAMAFTPYAAATALVPVALAVALRRWTVAAAAGITAAVLVGCVLPRAIGGPADAGGPRLVVMTANLRYGQGDAATVARLVREHRVDVLSLQELTPDAVGRLREAGVAESLPYAVVEPRADASGSGLMARRPLRPAGGAELTGVAHPEAALHVPGAGRVLVRAVHPLPPVDAAGARAWRYALAALPGPQEGRTPRVLAGDFNATLDHRAFRRLLDRGYVDAAAATGDGLRATWVPGPPRPPITIDHVLAPDGTGVRRTSVHRLPGSDHRIVVAELVLPRG